jgi:hypothetical protein
VELERRGGDGVRVEQRRGGGGGGGGMKGGFGLRPPSCFYTHIWTAG